MKIITKKAVYVQKNDIINLTYTDIPIPTSIFKKIFRSGSIVIINNNNRYEFEKFKYDSEIKFFKGLDCIVDYNSVKDLSDDEIIAIIQSIDKSKKQIAQQFNLMSENEREENFDMVTKFELLDFKMNSLRDILLFKQGHLKMTLPEDSDYQKNENGMQKIKRKIFTKRQN